MSSFLKLKFIHKPNCLLPYVMWFSAFGPTAFGISIVHFTNKINKKSYQQTKSSFAECGFQHLDLQLLSFCVRTIKHKTFRTLVVWLFGLFYLWLLFQRRRLRQLQRLRERQKRRLPVPRGALALQDNDPEDEASERHRTLLQHDGERLEPEHCQLLALQSGLEIIDVNSIWITLLSRNLHWLYKSSLRINFV